MIFRLLKPALFALDSETGHRLAINGLKALPLRGPMPMPGALRIRVAGIDFPNPVGVAAGFDKDAEVPDALLGLGFGFTEVGSITPLPQTGNPRPRLFRLVEDEAVINRMGFNNGGAEAALARLKARAGRPGIVGVNIGANKDSADRIADYAVMARMMARHASYLCVNISSPNTPGLRALQDESALTSLLDAVIAARGEAGSMVPIFLKVAPDLEPADIDAIARIAIDKALGARRCARTMRARPAVCRARLCVRLPPSACAISARRPAARSRSSASAASPAPNTRGSASERARALSSSIRRWSMKAPVSARRSSAGWRR